MIFFFFFFFFLGRGELLEKETSLLREIRNRMTKREWEREEYIDKERGALEGERQALERRLRGVENATEATKKEQKIEIERLKQLHEKQLALTGTYMGWAVRSTRSKTGWEKSRKLQKKEKIC